MFRPQTCTEQIQWMSWRGLGVGIVVGTALTPYVPYWAMLAIGASITYLAYPLQHWLTRQWQAKASA